MAETNKVLLDLEIQGTKEELAALAALKKSIDGLKDNVKKTAKVGGQYHEQQKLQLKATQTGYRQLAKDIDNRNKVEKSAMQTVEGLRAQYNRLNVEFNKSKIGSERARELSNTMAGLKTEIDKARHSVGDFRGNVGEYIKTVDISTVSIGEMRKALRELRNEPITGKSSQELEAHNRLIGELQDSYTKLDLAQRAKGIDTFQAVAGSAQFASGTLQTFAGAMNVAGIESEAFGRIQKQIVSLIAVTHGLKSIEETWHKGFLGQLASKVKGAAVDFKRYVQTTAQTRATAMQVKADAAQTVSTKVLYGSMAKLNAIMAANPVLAIVTGLALLGTAIYGVTRLIDRKTAAQKAELEIQKRVNEETGEEISKVQFLQLQIENSNASNESRIRAINDLKKIIPEYNGMLDEEGRLINHNTDAIKLYIVQYQKRIELQVREEKFIELKKKELELTEKLAEREGKRFIWSLKSNEALNKELNETIDAQYQLLDAVAALQVGMDGSAAATEKQAEAVKNLTKRTKEQKEEEATAASPTLEAKLKELDELQKLDDLNFQLEGASQQELLEQRKQFLQERLALIESFGEQETAAYLQTQLEIKAINESEGNTEAARLAAENEALQKLSDLKKQWELEDLEAALQVSDDKITALQAVHEKELELLDEKHKKEETSEAEKLRAIGQMNAAHVKELDALKQTELQASIMRMQTLVGATSSVLREVGGLFKQGTLGHLIVTEIAALADAFAAAVGAFKSQASIPIVGPVLAAAASAKALAMGLGMVNKIKALKSEVGGAKFAKGGSFEIGGKPHSQGGTKFVGEDGTKFEAEKGELITIVNKKDTQLINTLGGINGISGKKFGSGGVVQPRTFATGGIVQPRFIETQQDIAGEVARAIKMIKVVVSETDITETQNFVKTVKITGDL